jgi:aromatic ring-opening dioxygenase catalytic subunit (LigB family)
MTKPLPTYFISHGGGPWPWLRAQMAGVYDQLESSLADIPRQIGETPKAILMISGHWEEPEFTVMSSPAPGIIYDYSGFPEFTHSIRYGAPGAPAVAERVQELLVAAGLPARLDPQRGYDHGAFAPMAAISPDAKIPLLQLSIRSDYNIEAHLAAGRALCPLRSEGILLIGSGLSYHNLRLFGPAGRHPSHDFDAWLTQAVCGATGARRSEQLRRWASAPSARLAHPHEDHLIPLFVSVGAAEDEPGLSVYHEEAFFGALTVSSYRFGPAAGAAEP